MLKGAVIRSLYPEAWMRNSCDIDVLVNEDELDMAGDVLTSLGFERQSIQTLHDISYRKDNINIELHYRLIEDYRLTSGSEILCDVWEYASAGDGEYSFTLADEFFYFYHLAHMAKHFGEGGCGIRQVLDLWILNHRCEFDREARERLLKAGELDRFEGRMKMLAEYWFTDGDGDGLEYIEGYVLQGGVYGNGDNALAVKKGRMGRGGYLIYRFFPPANELVGRFPVLKNHKILLPVFWVVRWWRALFKKDTNHVERLKDEMVKTGEEREIQKMISELGIENFR